MTNLTAQEFFKADDIASDAVLSGPELSRVFWQLKKMQREAHQQQTFWKSVNDSMSDAYTKLAAFQEELKASREQLREVNAQLEQRTAALDEARQLAENVVASISDMLLVVDVTGVIQRVNHAAVERLGLGEDQLVGRPLQALFAGAAAQSAALPDDWLDVVLREGALTDLEIACVTTAGDLIPVVFSAAPLQSARDEVLGAVCIAKDITERRRAEQALQEQLDRIQTQQETIRALFTPIIQVWDGVLVMPIVGTLDRARVAEIMQNLLYAVVNREGAFVVLDLTGVKGVDTETADHLLQIRGAVALLGARCFLSGISGLVAQSFTLLGVDLRDLVSFRDLQSALHQALREMGQLPRASASAARAHDSGVTKPSSR